ncbi:substrate-binding domain-containing protein [Pseudothermotoga sp. U03pept]|uniref:substrate-binding domain-containing protein n=1 Tax=Pseudothermotoga sp. U03pept TaxID=3447012 RepID=UPI003F07E90D
MKKLFLLMLFFLSSFCMAKQLILATTSSLYNTGLLDKLKPLFEKQYNHSLSVLSLGTGLALEYGKRGDADLLLVHSIEDELAFMQQNHGVLRVSFMYNDFVIVGPTEKAVPSFNSAQELFEYIFQNKVSFVSRADESGTHKKEMQIWKSLGKTPSGSWYIQTGQDMARTLLIANEKRAFTLADRSTFVALKDRIDMKVFFENDPQLLNIYSIIVVNPQKSSKINYEGALDFVRFILDPKILKTIKEFSVNGTRLFNLLFEPR